MARGPLIILSGPSGAGKSTVIKRLLEEFPGRLRLSVSATTRGRREKEEEGVHYHFWTCQQFLHEVYVGGFLEWAEVHGNFYGTPRDEVEPFLARGVGVLLDIDVQGADQVRPRYPEHVSVFLRTSSLDVLKDRLEKRRTETEASIQKRLANARKELERAGGYQHQVINDDLETALAQLRTILEASFAGRE